MCVVFKKKKIISESIKERAIKKEEFVKKFGVNRFVLDVFVFFFCCLVEKIEFDVV